MECLRGNINISSLLNICMKKTIICLSAVAALSVLTGCVGPMGPTSAVQGGIYTDVSGPMGVTSNASASKTGEASSTGILGFATGDSSIKTAAANGGITRIQHVDFHTTTVLGIYGKTTTTVYGE
jgi:hypothetical protein